MDKINMINDDILMTFFYFIVSFYASHYAS